MVEGNNIDIMAGLQSLDAVGAAARRTDPIAQPPETDLDQATKRQVIVDIQQMWLAVRHQAATSGTRMTMKRSEERTSELQSLMRISYALFCFKKKNTR